jgi:hypothetical protein
MERPGFFLPWGQVRARQLLDRKKAELWQNRLTRFSAVC